MKRSTYKKILDAARKYRGSIIPGDWGLIDWHPLGELSTWKSDGAVCAIGAYLNGRSITRDATFGNGDVIRSAMVELGLSRAEVVGFVGGFDWEAENRIHRKPRSKYAEPGIRMAKTLRREGKLV